MENIISVIGAVILGSSDWLGIVIQALMLPGLWLIFEKCGEKGYRALIPVWRKYYLSKCVNREPDGKALVIMECINILLTVILILVPSDSLTAALAGTLDLVLFIIMMIYEVRLFNALCETFGRKKYWTLLWLLVPCIPALLWGLSREYMPVPRGESDEQGTIESLTAGREKGGRLTVDLDKRMAGGLINRKVLLRDIRMQIEPGSMVLLLGGSGAGKTTLLNAVTGYEKAKAKVTLGDGDVYADYKKMQYDIGFVPQGDLMRGTDTVRNTLTDAAALRMSKDQSKQQRRERVDEVMKVFGLLPVQSSLVEKLSGGQRKRLSIAMEFVSNPSLFILDEPDSGLDGVMARELMQQLRAIADQGKIVIVITHTPDRVIDLFDDVIVLAKDSQRTGRLAYYGPVDEAKAFFGKDTMEQIVRSVNRTEEGGEGRADEFIGRYAEVRYV